MSAPKQYLGLHGQALTTAISITAGLMFVAFGYGQADIGGLTTVESFRSYFPQIDGIGNMRNEHTVLIQGMSLCQSSFSSSAILNDILRCGHRDMEYWLFRKRYRHHLYW